MRTRHWIHRLASFSNSKINNVNGTSHYHQQQTSQHNDQHKRRTKHVATNLISSNPSADNNKQSSVNNFILFISGVERFLNLFFKTLNNNFLQKNFTKFHHKFLISMCHYILPKTIMCNTATYPINPIRSQFREQRIERVAT